MRISSYFILALFIGVGLNAENIKKEEKLNSKTELEKKIDGIKKLNKEASSRIEKMKQRWEHKKAIACAFHVGTKKSDIEKYVKIKMEGDKALVCPDDSFYISQVNCLKLGFKDGLLLRRDRSCSSQLFASLRDKNERNRNLELQEKLLEVYGEDFAKLSKGQQNYIIDNREIMRRITQEQLNRLAPVNIPKNLRVNAMNIFELYFHPNGDISGLKIISPSGHQILDDTTLQTVEYSYHRYPLPKEKTLIRYKMKYYLDKDKKTKVSQ